MKTRDDEMTEMHSTKPLASPGRRCFLKMMGVGSAAGALSACGGGGDGSPEAFGDVVACNVSELAVGSLRAVSGAPAIIGRDAQGVYAMTSTCTHEGCDMLRDGSVSNTGVVCNCHNSHFDAVGNRLSGPADSPLTHFAVDIDAAGLITIHGGQSVAASTRAPAA